MIRIQYILEPLAIAANVTQAAYTRLDHVLLTLGNLYQTYSHPELDRAVADKITNSLQKRWGKADQDVFILAVFFNPYIRHNCFNLPVLTRAHMYDIAARVLKRIFGLKDDIDFLRAFEDYFDASGEFSSQNMRLDMLKAMFEERVSNFNSPHLIPFL